METDKSNSNEKPHSSPKSSTNGDVQTEDFLIEFFPELTVSEEHSLSKDIKEMQQEENMLNGHRSLIDDLSIQNEKLKQMNKELKEKSLLQESQIAKYEADLSEKMQDVLTMNQELEKMKDKYEELNSVREGMEKEMTQLKVNIGQLLETRDQNNQASNQIIELQKDISSREKLQRKLRNEIEVSGQKLVEKNALIKRMKSANKKLWNIIMEMGNTLSKHGLLTEKKKEQYLKEIDDQMSDFVSEGDNMKVFLCGLSTSPVTTTSTPPMNQPLGVDPRSERPENCSNIKSYSSNYFMKTHQDVIEDLVSEDYNELNHFRQQLSVRNEPISPLPPTPPPKSAKFKVESHPPKSSVFAGKKLNFFHQQSESFEVENNEPTEKMPMNTSEYTISSKLNHDGSLKLDFSANYDTHLSFDMNTRQVSCTVMPSTRIQMDHTKGFHLISSTPQTASPHITLDDSSGTKVTSDHPKRMKADTKRIRSSPKSDSPFILSHEKKTLNDIGRSGKVYSAFIPPSNEKRVTVIPSVRVSPRQLKPPEEIDGAKEGTSPKNCKKRARKIKNSEKLSLNDKSKGKTKKRKTFDLENEQSKMEENNECHIDNNEEEPIEFQQSEVIASPKNSSSPSKSDIKLQKDSSSPSDPFKVPCIVSKDGKNQELSEQRDNDMDFSDIQVSPFNPSTFTPRGLFEDTLVSSDDHRNSEVSRAGDNSVSQPVNSNGETSCFENPSKESTNNHVDGTIKSDSANLVLSTLNNGVSSTINDSQDSDHSLVIAEDVEQNVSEGPSKSEGKRVSRKKKPRVKKISRKKEEAMVDTVTIDVAFKSLEEMTYTDAHFKQNQHTLVNALINPNNAAGSKDVAYQVLKYLISTRANPLMGYFMSEDEAVLMPLKEKCIVQALLQISRKKKLRLHGLVASILDTAYELILWKESLQIYGLSSLCRIVTEVCRCLEDKRRPLMLCSELLKVQHKFAPFLIASVAGVWKELFSVDNASDEEMIFHSSIVYGTQKKPPTLNEQQWKQCSKVLSTVLSAQFPYQINDIVPFLIHRIEGCLDSDEFILNTPLMVFTAVEGWNWAKEILIDQYIIPLLVKFSEQEINEKAFTVFCQLYADICYFCPNEEEPHEVFMEFFNNELDEGGGNEFVRNAAAMSQVKLLLHKKQLLPEYLTEWINQIQYRTDYVEYAEMLFRRRIMSTEAEFLKGEVR